MSSLPPKNVSPLWAPFNHRCTEQLVEFIVEDVDPPEATVGLAAIAAAVPALDLALERSKTASQPRDFKSFWYQINLLLEHVDDIPSSWKKYHIDLPVRLIGALAWAAVFAPAVAPRTQVLVAEFRFSFAGVLMLRVATCLRSRTCRVWSGRVCGAVCPGDVEGRARAGRWPRDVSPRPLPLHALKLVRMVAGLSPLCAGAGLLARGGCVLSTVAPSTALIWALTRASKSRVLRVHSGRGRTAGGRGWDESHLRSSPGYVTAVGGDLRAAGQHLRG
ncbi:hypothetical protein B0H13DRAFT_2372746 [Mycena leptocephala]|nr:hypothetical protein B0H13DRAFT_2372746 [Mycena leptocephala]